MLEKSRITLDRGSMAGRVTLERRTVQIPDVLADQSIASDRCRR